MIVLLLSLSAAFDAVFLVEFGARGGISVYGKSKHIMNGLPWLVMSARPRTWRAGDGRWKISIDSKRTCSIYV
jgi:hypothetical protein